MKKNPFSNSIFDTWTRFCVKTYFLPLFCFFFLSRFHLIDLSILSWSISSSIIFFRWRQKAKKNCHHLNTIAIQFCRYNRSDEWESRYYLLFFHFFFASYSIGSSKKLKCLCSRLIFFLFLFASSPVCNFSTSFHHQPGAKIIKMNTEFLYQVCV